MKRWRKPLCAVLAFVLALGLIVPVLAYTVPSDTVVYVADTGTKYHRDGCTYLKSQSPMTIEQAERAGYGPCSRCDPAFRTGPYRSNYDGRPSESSTEKAGLGTTSAKGKEKTDGSPLLFKILGWVCAVVLLGPVVLVFGVVIVGGVKYLLEKSKYSKLYGGHSPEELVEVPRGTEIGEDGLPKAKRTKGWGAAYTCYVTPKGRSYHREYGCSKATEKVHVCQVMEKKSPCAKCHPQTAEDLSWYTEYVRIKEIKRRYGIK